ncbi:MAG: hypothetical protein PHP74_01900 [Candidatus Gracilibacteria bacterium]|nr:hypothetical protein [Candidatus Gracilibacteria bacterium]
MSEEKEIDESPLKGTAETPPLDNAARSVSTSPEGMALEELQNQTRDAVADGANDSVGKCEIPANFLEEAKEFFGEEGARMLIEGINIYGEYELSHFKKHPRAYLEVSTRCSQLEEGIINGFIKKIEEKYISKQGLLKTDPIEIASRLHELLGQINIGVFEYPYILPEGVFIDGIFERIFRYLMCLIVKDEPKYRERYATEKRSQDNIKKKYERLSEIGILIQDESMHPLERAMLRQEGLSIQDELERSSWAKVSINESGKKSATLTSKLPFGTFVFEAVDDFERGKKAKSQEVGKDDDEVSTDDLKLENTIPMVFELLKNSWQPLLNGLELRGVKGVSAKAMKAENDRVFKIWKEEERREVEMCTVHNKTLTRAGLIMQLSPMEAHQGWMFGRHCVQVSYYDEITGEKIKNDRRAQEKERLRIIQNKQGADFFVVDRATQIPAIFLNRHTGEIEGSGVHSESIKALAKEEQSYEAIKRDILYYLAHLTCSATTLRKMYGEDHFKKKEPVDPQTEKESKYPNKKNKKNKAKRSYPYELDEKIPVPPAEIVFQVLQGETATYITGEGREMESEDIMTPNQVRAAVANLERHLTATEAVNHRMLLPLMKKPDVEDGDEVNFIAKQARERAKQLAKACGRILRRGIEFTSPVEGITEEGRVFHPERLNKLMDKCGAKTLEEIVEMFPGNAYIREETWVVPGGEEKKDAILHGYESIKGKTPEEVASRVKKAVIAVVPRRKKDG